MAYRRNSIYSLLAIAVFFGLLVSELSTQKTRRGATANLAQLSAGFEALSDKVSPATVQVLVMGYTASGKSDSNVFSRQRSTGSGVILDSKGYIVTNAHVVEGARRVQVVLSGQAQPSQGQSILSARGKILGAQIVGVDRETDLAVLKVQARNLPSLTLGNSDEVRQGQLVFAFGSPMGLENSVTMGVVSSTARQLRTGDPMIYLQTDAPINPGNSGGPLVGPAGEVIGINTLIFSQSGGSEGIGFAAPSNIVKNVYEQIRAAAWLEDQGYFEEAIQLHLRGKGPEAAGHLIGRHLNEIMNGEQWDRLGRWLAWLPPEIIDNDLELIVLKMWLLHNRGRYMQCFDLVDQALEILDASPGGANRDNLRAHIDFICYFRSLTQNDYAAALEYAENAFNRLPEEGLFIRVVAVVIKALALQVKGDLRRAYETVYDALSSDPPPTNPDRGRFLYALSTLHFLASDRQAMELAATEMLEVGQEYELAETIQWGRYYLGTANYYGNRLDAAEASLIRLADSKIVPNAVYFAQGSFALALAYEAKGESDKARERARFITEYMLKTGNKPILRLCEAFLAEMALRQGRLSEAVDWARKLEPAPLSLPWRFYVPEISLAKILIAEGSAGSRAQADDLLNRMEEFVNASHIPRFLIETFALKALLCEVKGDEISALDLLSRAVAVAQPGRWIRTFADLDSRLVGLLHRLKVKGDTLRFVGEIISAFHNGNSLVRSPLSVEPASGTPMQQPTLSQPLFEPLTPRELEILRLLAERLSNREIASRLFISAGTVKSHTHNIYEKLNVSGRRKVVEKALGLGMLSNR